ncbi:hypothetical protein ACOI1C_21860 [Bacillus sp. DJP31]
MALTQSIFNPIWMNFIIDLIEESSKVNGLVVYPLCMQQPKPLPILS